MKNQITKLMFATILFLGLYYAYTGMDGKCIINLEKVVYGLLSAIVSMCIIIKLCKYE